MYEPVWSDEAKVDLRKIYEYIKGKSEQGAMNVVLDIIAATKTVQFPYQYSKEEYFPKCRRIVVRDYKILYTVNEKEHIIYIVTIFDTRQTPDKLSNRF